jgi:hypothetical protein
MNRGNDTAVWERDCAFLDSLDGQIVAELSTQLLGLA